MLTIEEKPRTFNVVPFAAEGSGLVKEMHRKKTLSFRGILALVFCFLLGVTAAAVLLYSFF
jgi:hypothetical protein